MGGQHRAWWLGLAVLVVAAVAVSAALVLGNQLASGSSTATVRIVPDSPPGACVEQGETEVKTVEAVAVSSPGVCAATVDVLYDPDVKTVVDCEADPGGHFGTALCNTGFPNKVRFTGIKVVEGPTGTFPLAEITFRADGGPGESTVLDVVIETFGACPDGNPIDVQDDDGQNCIATPTPVVTATATATPTVKPPPCPDDDGDGLCNGLDSCPIDDDCDDDGLMDGSASSEDLNDDGVVDPGETDPSNWDTDGDGLSDGLEKGLTAPEGQDTDTTSPHWQPDADPSTMTDPLSADTDGDTTPDRQEDINANGAVDDGESDPGLVAFPLAQGWTQACYVGAAKSIDQALGAATGSVLAAYRLEADQTWGRWSPGRTDVSTISTINPYEQVFVLASEAVTWNQQFSGASQGRVALAEGWNSICYSGAATDMETAISSIAEHVGVAYALQADQTWGRYVPGRTDVSSLTYAARLAALLVLVMEDGATWVFNP